MRYVAEVDGSFHTEIPPPVREALALKELDRVAFVVKEGRVELEKLTSRAGSSRSWRENALALYSEDRPENLWG
jgi:bifunctional DNA-binding transcriptional regulator/antitoxin component of YhaV-PrlF toxin-antitoxin module